MEQYKEKLKTARVIYTVAALILLFRLLSAQSRQSIKEVIR
jgi:hypothetical protein